MGRANGEVRGFDLARRAQRVTARFVPGHRRKHHGRLYVVRRTTAAWLRSRAERRGGSAPPACIDTAAFEAQLPRGAVRDAFPGEVADLDPPRDAARRFARIPGWYPSDRWKLHHELAPTPVLQVPHGVVFGREGWIGPDPERVVADWNTYARKTHEIGHACRTAIANGVVELPGTTASLLQLGWGNYFHWMLQGLPRLLAVLEVGDRSGVDRFLVDGNRPFVAESFARLGLGDDRLERVGAPDPAFRCETLVTARLPDVYAPIPRWGIERVRALFAPARGAAGAPRIYIRRGATPRRRVVNEDDVVAVLDRHGFVTVSMDAMTVAEQAAQFAAAEVVVGAHGAALTNLVFARPGTHVVELLPANDPKPLYWHLAAQTGAVYDVLVGSEPALRRRHDVWMNDADLVVDVRELERIVVGSR